MTASDGATDAQVREALQAAGLEVGTRGRISAEQYAAYERLAAAGSSPPAAAADDGWPTADLGDGPAAPTVPLPPPPPAPPADPVAEERAPRVIGGSAPRPGAGTGARIIGRLRTAAGGGDAPPKDSGKGKGRQQGGRGRGGRPEQPWRPTAGVIGTIWERLAMASGSIPPLQRILAAQAPMAGVVLEGQLRGSLIDRVALQRAARMEAQADAVLAMAGVPILTAWVAMKGRVQTVPGPDGQAYPAYKPDGMPAWEPGTEMMIISLRYCLMSWLAVTDRHGEEIIAQAEASVRKGKDADEIIKWIFGMGADPGPQAWEDLQADAAARTQDFMRPPAPGAADGPGAPQGPPPPSSAFRPAITGTVLA